MDRRTFLGALASGLLAAPHAAGQQVAKVWRIGYLGNGNPTQSATLNGFRLGLREFGWLEGQNVSIAYRWADGNLDRLPALASDLVKVPLDVLHLSGFPAVRAALQATRTVPIVSALMGDPVAAGFAASLARPGGNVTGLTVQFQDLATKQLQMLKETVAKVVRVAILYDLTTPNADVLQAAEAAARALGLKGRVLSIRAVPDLEGAFRTARAEDAKAMYVMPSPMLARHRPRLAELAVKYQLPGIYEEKGYVAAGGLMSYGPNFPDLFRRSASYVDRIFKGAKPGDLPIEQPTTFELVINLKTAKALGLTIPRSLLQQADQVIE
ncbi:MAG TPA: ABC transporter substrate-binding protein [Propionibacteriaceae bacterium]|nr:ABC transporter substrate-binding protein [Propionibacteriaceae bacterium]